jgi:hypothetical protein
MIIISHPAWLVCRLGLHCSIRSKGGLCRCVCPVEAMSKGHASRAGMALRSESETGDGPASCSLRMIEGTLGYFHAPCMRHA